jgi:ABC-type dipeptide/oligopeptide/nickel transport system ATPase component
MKTIEINKLNSIFKEQSRSLTEQMNLSDTFASACFLHASGHQRAGKKLLNELFDLLGWYRRKTYFNSFLDTLSGNEERYAMGVSAHEEIKSLFEAQHPAQEA